MPSVKSGPFIPKGSLRGQLEEDQGDNPVTQVHLENVREAGVCMCVNHANHDRSSITQQPRPPATDVIQLPVLAARRLPSEMKYKLY